MSAFSEANELVNGKRQEDYGTPEDCFGAIAEVWSGLLGFEITPQDVPLMMIGLKLVRDEHKPKRDNIVDALGYLLCAKRLQRASERV